MTRSSAYTLGSVALCLFVAGVAYAQESTNPVAHKADWSVFVEKSPTKECWVVSSPTSVVNKRGGKVVSAKRGDILMFVSYRPSSGVSGEVSFTGGYPFAPNSKAVLSIGGSNYDLFTEGEWAWTGSAAEDAKVITSMKRGAKAVVKANSKRPTYTTDTFSLTGFTAALDEAKRLCK